MRLHGNHLLAAGLLALFAAGCASATAGNDKKDSGTSCNDNNDCRPGYVCVGNQCIPLGSDGGGHPAIQVAPTSLVFDQALIGSPQSLSVTITNVGSGALNITSVSLVENDAVKEFSLTQPSRTSLAPNESVMVQVTLDPTDTLLDTGTLTIESNDMMSPAVTVSLSSAAIGDPDLKICVDSGEAPPDECADPLAIDYGEVAYGTLAQAGFYLANVGTGNKTITVSEVKVTSLSPSHSALFGVELFTMVETSPGSGTWVETPATLPLSLSPTAGGDPDPMALYGRLSFTANTDGFLILQGDVMTVTTSTIDEPTPVDSTVPIAATINGCPQGLQDLNGDPADGCEYACTVTNGGVEACDGLDNDCDGTVDGHSEPCYTASDGGCNADGTGCKGICQAGTRICTNANWGTC
ncbi:MAG: choice-of-anchor D domain-containing protein, partial [Polyangia bacterium]|nr:choice-of-anchor D domain-containing protein [Polyangia bacterium]